MPRAHTTLMGGAACIPSGVLYHRTDPPPPDCALAGLLYHQGSQGRGEQQAVVHLQDKVVCIRPLLLYLFTSQVRGWAFVVQDGQLSRCLKEKVRLYQTFGRRSR